MVKRKTTEAGIDKPHVTSAAEKSVDRREVRNPVTPNSNQQSAS